MIDTKAIKTKGKNGNLVCKLIFLTAKNNRLHRNDKKSASNNKRQLFQKPIAKPVIKKVIPSPSPICPLVNLQITKRITPIIIPPILSDIGMASKNPPVTITPNILITHNHVGIVLSFKSHMVPNTK